MFAIPYPAEPTMRTTARLSLALLLATPALAHANCYSVYNSQNHLSFQSTVAPVDLSRRISEAMAQRFPGGHLIITPDTSDCREVRFSREPAPPRVAPGQPAPMLTNVRPAGAANRSGAEGEAVESEPAAPRRGRARR
jgi:hypothetical protein